MKTNERRERRRRPEMKQIVAKSKVPSATEAEGKRKVEFKDDDDDGSVNGKLELKSEGKCEGDENIVEVGINGKYEGIASEPLATKKKGNFLIDELVVVGGG